MLNWWIEESRLSYLAIFGFSSIFFVIMIFGVGFGSFIYNPIAHFCQHLSTNILVSYFFSFFYNLNLFIEKIADITTLPFVLILEIIFGVFPEVRRNYGLYICSGILFCVVIYMFIGLLTTFGVIVKKIKVKFFFFFFLFIYCCINRSSSTKIPLKIVQITDTHLGTIISIIIIIIFI
jgi:predicted MPP superfamily phosphohydrolase